MNATDEMIAAYVVEQFRQDRNGVQETANPSVYHLAHCPDTTATVIDKYTGAYGCETGCEFARIESDVSCPHVAAVEYDTGDFGELPDLLKDIYRWSLTR